MFTGCPQPHPSCQPLSQTTKSNSSILAEIKQTAFVGYNRPCRPSSRTNVQVIQLPCVKNAILLFFFFSLQFRRHTICTGILTSDYSTIRTTFRRYLFLDVAHHHLSKREASDLSNYADQTYSGGQGLQL